MEQQHIARRLASGRSTWVAVFSLLVALSGTAGEPVPPGLAFSANPTVQEIFRARVFEEPLVPIGGEPSMTDNADLAAALRGYALRSGPDDFSSLTAFLKQHPTSVWRAALLTGLGSEYYNTAHYSLALEAWKEAWAAGKNADTAHGKAVGDRAGAELACMNARLGRMEQLEAFLQSIQDHKFFGPSAEKISNAREALWLMKNRPEIAFRCGPLALQRVLLSDQKLLASCPTNAIDQILKSASTQKGLSLPQIAELSKQVGLNYQMALRADGAFIVPSVVHWKVGHYAALVRQVGDRYLLQDPTFRNDVWATRQALEAETTGYFLVPPGPLAQGWRTVEAKEGETVWGKGAYSVLDSRLIGPRNKKTGPPVCHGMVVPQTHLMAVNLSLVDQPVGYTPPVGPAVGFTVRYNMRDGNQPADAAFSNLGPGWSCDWVSYITDNPQSPLADVSYYNGGGVSTFTGFDTNTQTYAYQLYDQTLLTRTATNPISYNMVWGDGSQMIFSQSDGSIGTVRRIFLTQVLDPQGNAVTLTYDTNLLLVAITDAIGQVTTLTHGLPESSILMSNCPYNPSIPFISRPYGPDPYAITKVTDPFGRSASFHYEPAIWGFYVDGKGCVWPLMNYQLTAITDVYGLTSHINFAPFDPYPQNGFYYPNAYFPVSLFTPYGTTTFNYAGSDPSRFLEITYPDGSRDRVESNQNVPGLGTADPVATVPQGMNTYNAALFEDNTCYWSRNACATSYGDYSKARIYHFVHSTDYSSAADILHSTKQPLENRVWFDYAGQGPGNSGNGVGSTSLPQHVGRVLDDGTTQLFTYGYNGFGRLTNSVDPLGRTFSYLYATNGIDLLEVRMTRAGQNQLLFSASYNSQHRPLTTTDVAGQTTSYSYNARGQLLSVTNPRSETISFDYDINGYTLAVHGPLPGTNDTVTATYDAFGRPRTITDVSGYTLTLDYDNLDRVTQVTYPDGTFEQVTYTYLDPTVIRDRAGRLTVLNYDSLRQLTQIFDPLGRATHLEWCRCGGLKSLTDPLGRTTSWLRDVQGRLIAKQFTDGSQITYSYENTTSRFRQITDEKQQSTYFSFNLDNTFRSIAYANATVPTAPVSFTYDPDYERLTSMSDGVGTRLYSYNPIAANPALGAGRLATLTGPLPNETLTYGYDELGRLAHRTINGVNSAITYDAAGRFAGASNALGYFSYTYDGASRRLLSETLPNGQTATRSYGSILQDFALQRITHQLGPSLLSEFLYEVDVPASRIISWSQQAGAQPPNVFSLAYDAANQLLSAAVTNSGAQVNIFAYSYDAAANRLSEQVGGTTSVGTYNALNQLSTSAASGASRTNEWDGENRLTAVNAGNQRTEFAYDGENHLVGIRQLVSGAEVSHRLFVWSGNGISEERDTNGLVTKRFFYQGVQLVNGTNAGAYYYTRDHLGSIRELTDAGGNLRARYAYDPFGRRTKVGGDLDADFGFAGMFLATEANLYLTHFRAYDPDLGRWLSRDPLKLAELSQGPNLYAYVGNEPISRIDPQGLCTGSSICACAANPVAAAQCAAEGIIKVAPVAAAAAKVGQEVANHGEELVVAAEEGGSELEACVAELPGVVERLSQTGAGGVHTAQPLLNNLPSINNQILPYLNTQPLVPEYLEDTIPSAETLAGDAANWEWADLWLRATQNWRGPMPGDPALWDEWGEETFSILERWAEMHGRGEPW